MESIKDGIQRRQSMPFLYPMFHLGIMPNKSARQVLEFKHLPPGYEMPAIYLREYVSLSEPLCALFMFKTAFVDNPGNVG